MAMLRGGGLTVIASFLVQVVGRVGQKILGDIDCIFDRSQLRATIKEVLMLEN